MGRRCEIRKGRDKRCQLFCGEVDDEIETAEGWGGERGRQSDNQTIRQSDNQTIRQSDEETGGLRRWAEVFDDLGEGAGAVAEAVFGGGGELAKGFAFAVGDEEGVVTEAAFAALAVDDGAF